MLSGRELLIEYKPSSTPLSPIFIDPKQVGLLGNHAGSYPRAYAGLIVMSEGKPCA
jgi:hypothetical protein